MKKSGIIIMICLTITNFITNSKSYLYIINPD